jgi:hypothetical protein
MIALKRIDDGREVFFATQEGADKTLKEFPKKYRAVDERPIDPKPFKKEKSVKEQIDEVESDS